MRLSFHTRVSMVARGEDLYVVTVLQTPWRTTVRHGPTLRDFRAMPVEQARAALSKVKGAHRITLTCDESWCSIRPIQIKASNWKQAREEVRLSIDRLLPLSPDDAMVGVIDMDDSTGDGTLLAVRRSTVQEWIDHIEEASGARVVDVLAPHMSMLALGHQRDEQARVIELDNEGTPIGEHRFRYGAPVQFDAPFTDNAETDEASFVAGPREIGVASALAPMIGAGRYAPLQGRTPPPPRRWLAPAAAGGLAILVFIGAGSLFEGRLQHATARAESRQLELVEPLRLVRDTRADTERHITLLRDGLARSTSDWQSVLPLMTEVERALGAEGFLRRLEISREYVIVQGESPSATSVLEAMEASSLLQEAQLSAPTSVSSQSGLDMFSIRARRSNREGGAE